MTEAAIVHDPALGDSHVQPDEAALLHLECSAHRCHRSVKKTLELAPSVSSGVLNLALSMRASGALSVFRRFAAEEIENRLRVFLTAPSHDATQWQRTILGIHTHRGGRRGRRVALSLARWANGDWQNTTTVHHHCGA